MNRTMKGVSTPIFIGAGATGDDSSTKVGHIKFIKNKLSGQYEINDLGSLLAPMKIGVGRTGFNFFPAPATISPVSHYCLQVNNLYNYRRYTCCPATASTSDLFFCSVKK